MSGLIERLKAALDNCQRTGWINISYADLESAVRALSAPQPAPVAADLTVWCGAMPESNGKSNFTAILMRKGGDFVDGHTIDRSEYPDRVRYEADRVRYLLGELKDRPWILDYDADKHSGYVSPLPAQQGGVADERFEVLLCALVAGVCKAFTKAGGYDYAAECEALRALFKQSRLAAPAQLRIDDGEGGMFRNATQIEAMTNSLWNAWVNTCSHEAIVGDEKLCSELNDGWDLYEAVLVLRAVVVMMRAVPSAPVQAMQEGPSKCLWIRRTYDEKEGIYHTACGMKHDDSPNDVSCFMLAVCRCGKDIDLECFDTSEEYAAFLASQAGSEA